VPPRKNIPLILSPSASRAVAFLHKTFTNHSHHPYQFPSLAAYTGGENQNHSLTSDMTL
jgi:hypothetical protein